MPKNTNKIIRKNLKEEAKSVHYDIREETKGLSTEYCKFGPNCFRNINKKGKSCKYYHPTTEAEIDQWKNGQNDEQALISQFLNMKKESKIKISKPYLKTGAKIKCKNEANKNE